MGTTRPSKGFEMPTITDLANAIRKDNPKDLFCLVEFGDHGKIVCFSSGKGYAPRGNNINSVIRTSSRIIFVEEKTTADGEERMVRNFEKYYAECGNGAQHITIITAASPCSEVCATLLKGLVESFAGVIKTWVIAYHAPYLNARDTKKFGGLDTTLSMLNFSTEQVRCTCFKVHEHFIDSSTLH
jgi:hypothetical protein